MSKNSLPLSLRIKSDCPLFLSYSPRVAKRCLTMIGDVFNPSPKARPSMIKRYDQDLYSFARVYWWSHYGKDYFYLWSIHHNDRHIGQRRSPRDRDLLDQFEELRGRNIVLFKKG